MNYDGFLSVLKSAVQAIGNLNQTLSQSFPAATGTAGSATGGAATLPGNPVGFITTVLPGTTTTVKIPYYS